MLNQDSFIRKLVSDIPEDDWQEIEIIGWLYQFYIADEKDRVIGSKSAVKAQDIPAATQLFTPNWIVRYMIENSVGRLWLEGHPESKLKEHMPYYLESPEGDDSAPVPPAEQGKPGQGSLPFTLAKPEQAAAAKIEKPQDLTVMDPACGSGHILIYAFDLLFEIYKEAGYPERDIARLILENNLYGLDIDERAVQLASFAVLMKAREKSRRILRKGEVPNLNILQVKHSRDLSLPTGLNKDDWQPLLDAFKDADNLGSLISPPELDYDRLKSQLKSVMQGGLFGSVEEWQGLLRQAEVLGGQYASVVANPPWMGKGAQNKTVKTHLETKMQEKRTDVFEAFIERCLSLTTPNGTLGLTTPAVWMFIKSYESLRERLISETTIRTLVQLEYNSFPSVTVPVCAFALSKPFVSGALGQYIRLVDFRGTENQGPKTLEAITHADRPWRHMADQKDFEKLPGKPFAYWASKNFIRLFEKSINVGTRAVKGLDTNGNFDRFFRKWPEIGTMNFSVFNGDTQTNVWYPIAKGGKFRKWYGNQDFVINYAGEGKELRSVSANLRSQAKYLREGLTWTTVSSSTFAIRYLPQGFLFDQSGSAMFLKERDSFDIYEILASLNSKLTEKIADFISPTLSFTAGDVRKFPIWKNKNSLNIIRQCVEISKDEWDCYEESWDFQTHPLLRAGFKRLAEAFADWSQTSDEAFFELKRLEEENNRYWIEAYGLQDELSPDVPEDQITIRRADLERDIKSLISYGVGCMFGRYSLSKAGLQFAGGEFSLANFEGDFLPDPDGILPITDEAYFADDIVTAFTDFMSVAYGADTLQENLEFVAEALTKRSDETAAERLRRYFLTDFVKDHNRTYSKRPIYWLFTSGKERAFSALIYLHRYKPDTLATLRNDYVLPLQSKLSSEISQAEQAVTNATTASTQKREEKRLKTLRDQYAELQVFQDKLQHAADQRIELDLDDGVAYNYTLFEGLVYEGSDLKMDDLKKKSEWKRELLAQVAS